MLGPDYIVRWNKFTSSYDVYTMGWSFRGSSILRGNVWGATNWGEAWGTIKNPQVISSNTVVIEGIEE